MFIIHCECQCFEAKAKTKEETLKEYNKHWYNCPIAHENWKKTGEQLLRKEDDCVANIQINSV